MTAFMLVSPTDIVAWVEPAGSWETNEVPPELPPLPPSPALVLELALVIFVFAGAGLFESLRAIAAEPGAGCGLVECL